MLYSHYMQDADERGQTKEVWVCLHKHPLDLIQFTATSCTLLLRGLSKALGHGGKNLEFPVGHRLKGDLKREHRGCGVDFDVLRPQVPEIIWEYYRLVDSFCARLISHSGDDMDIYERKDEELSE